MLLNLLQPKTSSLVLSLIEEEPARFLCEGIFENYENLPERVTDAFEKVCKNPEGRELMNQINANKRNSSEPWQIVMDSYYHPKLGVCPTVRLSDYLRLLSFLIFVKTFLQNIDAKYEEFTLENKQALIVLAR